MNEFRRTRNWINQNIQSYFHNRFSKCDKSIGSGINYCFINRMKLITIHPLNSPFSQNDNWYYRVRYVEYKYSSSLHPKKKKKPKGRTLHHLQITTTVSGLTRLFYCHLLLITHQIITVQLL